MTTPEQEIVADIVARMTMLRTSLDEAFELVGPVPADLSAFKSMNKVARISSTAVIKIVEQIGDQIARLFRTILRAMDVDTSGWFAQDTANYMEKLGIVADAGAWVGIVKLRNRLVHDYPVDPAAQFARFTEAYAAAAVLHDTAGRLTAFLKGRGLL